MKQMARLSQDERMQKIIQAAARAFARAGFRGTRTRDIAREAGVSEGLVFKYFPDKKSLQKAILEARLRQTGPLITEGVLRLPPPQALRAVAAGILERTSLDPDFMRILFFSALEGEPLASMLYRKRHTRGIGGLTRLIRSWASRGLIERRIDAKLAAWLFIAGVYHLMVSRHVFGVSDFMDEKGDLAEKSADIFLKGIGR
jgi:TetR/AcrR family transcriptional regulator